MPTSATSFSTGLVLIATSFSLGILYSNWSYDYFTLWKTGPGSEDFERSLHHYQTIANTPVFIFHVHHFIIALGLIGFFLKLYKPSESNKLFDGGSLFLYMVGVAIYLSNLRTGLNSSVAGEWGDVDEATGINVIAASQVMIVLTLIGVLGLQFGQFWAERENTRIVAEAIAAERAEEAKKDK